MKTKDGTFHLYIFFPAMGEIKIALDSVRNPPPPSTSTFAPIVFMEQKRGKRMADIYAEVEPPTVRNIIEKDRQ
jgi:hypothetical protein